MSSEIYIIGAVAFVIGCFIGWALWYWKNRETKQMQKILNDPEQLIKKLKAHGKIYDEGHPINIGINYDYPSSRKVITIEKGEEIKPKARPKPVKTEKAKKKVKKKLKGKK